jgi:endogenous inhibitor of DNA gyrase (YacG/DUF329 family)/predicted nucleic-acid-binding Zn-ribbon protein
MPKVAPKIPMACPHCGKVELRWTSQSRGFCGPDCYHAWTRGKYFKKARQIEIPCIECGRARKFANYYDGIRKFCSRKCYALWRQKLSGEATNHWKGGTTKPSVIGRNTVAGRAWREAVKIRDRNRCVKCGSTEKLHVHHIKAYTLHLELRFDVNNGQTLCAACHHTEHRGVRRIRRAA